MSDMWDSVAPGWDANFEFVDRHLADATAAMLDAAAIGAGDSILDLATGPGGAGLAAAERVGPSGSVILSDDAPQMVAVAARRASAHSQVSTAVFEQDSIAAEDGTFDAVIIRHGLMFAEDHAGAVREAARVLKPGAHYAAMTWAQRERNPWLGLVLDAVGEQFGVPFPPPGIPGPFALDEPALLASALEGGGLSDVRVREIETPMHAASLQDWWDRVPKMAGPLAMALAGMEPEVRGEIEQRALAAGALASQAVGQEIVMGGAVLVGSGQTPS
jgi:SAM-dependent methyltransferase